MTSASGARGTTKSASVIENPCTSQSQWLSSIVRSPRKSTAARPPAARATACSTEPLQSQTFEAVSAPATMSPPTIVTPCASIITPSGITAEKRSAHE